MALADASIGDQPISPYERFKRDLAAHWGGGRPQGAEALPQESSATAPSGDEAWLVAGGEEALIGGQVGGAPAARRQRTSLSKRLNRLVDAMALLTTASMGGDLGSARRSSTYKEGRHAAAPRGAEEGHVETFRRSLASATVSRQGEASVARTSECS